METLSPSDLLPHKPPMVLVDDVLRYDLELRQCICGITIREESPFFEGDQGVPGYVGIEYIAQTVGVLAGLQQRASASDPMQLGFLLGFAMESMQCAWFTLGTRLEVEVNHIWGEESLLQLQGEVRDASSGEICCRAKVNVFRPEDADKFLEEALL